MGLHEPMSSGIGAAQSRVFSLPCSGSVLLAEGSDARSAVLSPHAKLGGPFIRQNRGSLSASVCEVLTEIFPASAASKRWIVFCFDDDRSFNTTLSEAVFPCRMKFVELEVSAGGGCLYARSLRAAYKEGVVVNDRDAPSREITAMLQDAKNASYNYDVKEFSLSWREPVRAGMEPGSSGQITITLDIPPAGSVALPVCDDARLVELLPDARLGGTWVRHNQETLAASICEESQEVFPASAARKRWIVFCFDDERSLTTSLHDAAFPCRIKCAELEVSFTAGHQLCIRALRAAYQDRVINASDRAMPSCEVSTFLRDGRPAGCGYEARDVQVRMHSVRVLALHLAVHDPTGSEMRVSCTTLAGAEAACLRLPGSSTVAELRAELLRQLGLGPAPAQALRLVHGSDLLSDAPPGDSVTLLQLRGGASPGATSPAPQYSNPLCLPT
mmetsp:Transcript_4370/g.11866  ORF Transcript_4370/g.11866 Transcript_4370/m.11866 type:complete len:444 (+) Transcript_4370:46-1377(+)